jgi:hypothetical protein
MEFNSKYKMDSSLTNVHGKGRTLNSAQEMKED